MVAHGCGQQFGSCYFWSAGPISWLPCRRSRYSIAVLFREKGICIKYAPALLRLPMPPARPRVDWTVRLHALSLALRLATCDLYIAFIVVCRYSILLVLLSVCVASVLSDCCYRCPILYFARVGARLFSEPRHDINMTTTTNMTRFAIAANFPEFAIRSTSAGEIPS